jgi:transcriptional antiterminator RfaH
MADAQIHAEPLCKIAVCCEMELRGTNSSEAWFCLRTPPRREQMAAGHLRKRVGIEVFAPQIDLRSPKNGATRQPLFPGYLFARFHYPQQLRHVISSQGVTGILRGGEGPSVVSDGVIEFLRREIACAQNTEPAPTFTNGESVKIVHGCFSQVEGRVLSSDSATERVRVLLRLLGQDIQVSVPAGQLISTEGKRTDYPASLLAEQDVAPFPGSSVHQPVTLPATGN